jgi:hypothetical protein
MGCFGVGVNRAVTSNTLDGLYLGCMKNQWAIFGLHEKPTGRI